MNQQPDKFFRDKLQSFHQPAPSGAWSRIEANLDKKNNKVLWYRIAASLLLVAIAAYLLWPSTAIKTPQPELANKTKTEKAVTPKEQKTETPTPLPLPAEENRIAKQEKQPIKSVVRKKQNALSDEELKVSDDRSDKTEDPIAVLDANDIDGSKSNLTSAETNPIPVTASAEPEKLKIIFSPEEVDNKYLDKKALAEATSDEKKPSTLKKLLDKAYDLKYNQDPFGDLRQRKDEILALNFRKDKRSDNK